MDGGQGWARRLLIGCGTVADALRDRLRQRSLLPERALGWRAEDLAARYLQRQGCRVVARNYRTRGGTAEVDLIAWDGRQIVFIEVKARQSESFAAPERNVDPGKQDKILRAADEYLHRASLAWQDARFDVIAVVFSHPLQLRHHKAVFGAVMR